ncbi:uncharacterized protein LOC110410065 [Herrania umbratica]|uniref:Uncharacterized protein LOC110410065 n=1 Tax=Herrania umbratica TaxID=108875 RepID=A0A6J0ZM23_9ROSI|nr:uncharacterized protein LOC110410065 [Herrania umbratica]
MGACASSTSNPKSGRPVGAGGGEGSSTIGRSSTTSAKVVHIDGHVQEFGQPIQAKGVVSQNPNCFLCSSESMSVGTCVPRLPDDEELQSGQIYFLLPLSQSDKPLSLPDLCSLAIKASSGIRKDSVDHSSSNSKLIPR